MRRLDDANTVTALRSSSKAEDYQGKSFSKTIRLADDAAVMVDGLQAQVEHAIVVGRTVAVHPARGKTIIALTRGLPKRDGDTSF